jgi:hypothetical protein
VNPEDGRDIGHHSNSNQSTTNQMKVKDPFTSYYSRPPGRQP